MRKILLMILVFFSVFVGCSYADDVGNLIAWLHGKWLTKFEQIDDFRPRDWITREEASKFYSQLMINVYNWYDKVDSDRPCQFNDINIANPDLTDDIDLACKLWIFQWYNWSFNPKGMLTNAEAMTVLVRIVDWEQSPISWFWYSTYYNEAANLWMLNWFIEWAKEFSMLNWLKINDIGYANLSAKRWELWLLMYGSAKYVDNIPYSHSDSYICESSIVIAHCFDEKQTWVYNQNCVPMCRYLLN